MTRRPVHMVEPSEPDFEISNAEDVYKVMLKGHIDLDDERFKSQDARLKSIEQKLDWAGLGIIGTVALGVMHLILK